MEQLICLLPFNLDVQGLDNGLLILFASIKILGVVGFCVDEEIKVSISPFIWHVENLSHFAKNLEPSSPTVESLIHLQSGLKGKSDRSYRQEEGRERQVMLRASLDRKKWGHMCTLSLIITLPHISSYAAVTYCCKRPLNCCIRSNAAVWEPMHLTPVAKGYCNGLEMQL